MREPAYILDVRRPAPFMICMVEAFCGDAHMSLEGDLSKLNWAGSTSVDPRVSVLLRRHTVAPKQDYVVLPLEPETIPEIKQRVLPVVGLARRVFHVQIEQHRNLVFGSYDQFYTGLVWVTQRIGSEFLDGLRRNGCLKSYKPYCWDLESSGALPNPELYLVDLLTEQDVSLDEAFRAFGGDREHALRVLNIYVGTGCVVLKDGDEVVPEWRVRELLRAPTVFDEHGHLCMSPSLTYDRAREQGQI